MRQEAQGCTLTALEDRLAVLGDGGLRAMLADDAARNSSAQKRKRSNNTPRRRCKEERAHWWECAGGTEYAGPRRRGARCLAMVGAAGMKPAWRVCGCGTGALPAQQTVGQQRQQQQQQQPHPALLAMQRQLRAQAQGAGHSTLAGPSSGMGNAQMGVEEYFRFTQQHRLREERGLQQLHESDAFLAGVQEASDVFAEQRASTTTSANPPTMAAHQGAQDVRMLRRGRGVLRLAVPPPSFLNGPQKLRRRHLGAHRRAKWRVAVLAPPHPKFVNFGAAFAAPILVMSN
ncbi:hypothetical protein C8J57DRAFT_1605302 [Mycena rebaudengoi]|nr:hypothetical protein C8J57DRAFT_1605302 [Mycena rebaudengoi]